MEDRIAALQAGLDELKADVRAQKEAEAAQASSPSIGIESVNGVVAEKAQALATAVARQQGHDLPLQAGGQAAQVPVLNIDPSMLEGLGGEFGNFAKFGGVGVVVISAAPTPAARAA